MVLQLFGTFGWSMLGTAAIVAAVSLAAAFLRLEGIVGRMCLWIPFIGPVIRNESYVLFTGCSHAAGACRCRRLAIDCRRHEADSLDAKCRAAAAESERRGLGGRAGRGGLPRNPGLLCRLGQAAERPARRISPPAAEVFEARAAAYPR